MVPYTTAVSSLLQTVYTQLVSPNTNAIKYGIIGLTCFSASSVRSICFPQTQQPEVLPVILFHGKVYVKREEYDATLRTVMGGSNVAAGVGDGFNTFVTVADAQSDGVWLDWNYSRARDGEKDALWMPQNSEVIKVPQHLLKEIRSRDLVPPFSTLINADDVKKDKVYNWRIRSVHIARHELDASAEKLGVVFIGDSVHAMPIFGGEGGNHALLDGVELFKLIRACLDSAGSRVLAPAQVIPLVQKFYDGNLQRSQDAVKRCVQRFSGFHKPMEEWLKVASMAKQRNGT